MLIECCGFDTVGPHIQEKPTDTDSSTEKTLECDYDKNPTILYQAIEDKAWGPTMKILDPPKEKTAKKYEVGESPEEQTRTWVSRHEKNGDLRWSQLPLHAAIIFGAPYQVVEKLVQLYPQALKSKDDQAMLPLHLSFRYGSSDDIVYLILERYPNAINVRGHKNRLPLECARKNGPNYKRALIIQAFTNKLQTELNSVVSHSHRDREVGHKVKKLEKELDDTRLDVDKLKRENEILKHAASSEAFEAERKKVIELQKHVEVLTTANKMLAMNDIETKSIIAEKEKFEKEKVKSEKDKGKKSKFRSLSLKSKSRSSGNGSVASVVVELAQAEAQAEMKKKEAEAQAMAESKKKEAEEKIEDEKNDNKLEEMRSMQSVASSDEATEALKPSGGILEIEEEKKEENKEEWKNEENTDEQKNEEDTEEQKNEEDTEEQKNEEDTEEQKNEENTEEKAEEQKNEVNKEEKEQKMGEGKKEDKTEEKTSKLGTETEIKETEHSSKADADLSVEVESKVEPMKVSILKTDSKDESVEVSTASKTHEKSEKVSSSVKVSKSGSVAESEKDEKAPEPTVEDKETEGKEKPQGVNESKIRFKQSTKETEESAPVEEEEGPALLVMSKSESTKGSPTKESRLKKERKSFRQRFSRRKSKKAT